MIAEGKGQWMLRPEQVGHCFDPINAYRWHSLISKGYVCLLCLGGRATTHMSQRRRRLLLLRPRRGDRLQVLEPLREARPGPILG
jgi:hypothetical protein